MIKKLFLILIFTIFFFSYSTIDNFALTKREVWLADEALYSKEAVFRMPKSLRFVEVELSETRSCDRQVRNLQYYLTTRFFMSDLPAHYFLCNQELYQLAKDGPESEINLGETSNEIIVWTSPSESVVNKDIQKMLESYAIEDIILSKLQININEEEKSYKLSLLDSENSSLSNSINSLKDLSSTKSPEYKLSVNFEEMEQSYKQGDIVEVKMSLKNIGDVGIYGENISPIFLITENPFDKTSKFYAGEEYWSSFSRVALFKPKDVLKVNDEKVISLFIKFVPNASQDFILGTLNGIKISNTRFSVNTDREQVKLIQAIQGVQTEKSIVVSGAPNDFLRVRESSNIYSVEIDRVYNGEVYKVISEENGWYKISKGNLTGWISGDFIVAL
ncbi:SH3 domain-containing protein [bacterium]|nr:MAG: SH3 domain-containing protein [bacterium]